MFPEPSVLENAALISDGCFCEYRETRQVHADRRLRAESGAAIVDAMSVGNMKCEMRARSSLGCQI